MSDDAWPELSFDAWRETRETLHMWTQIVGKARLAKSPWVNHSWHVALYVTARGLTTSPVPDGDRVFEIDFDFVGHELVLRTSDGGVRAFSLQPMTVASFYRLVGEELAQLGVDVQIDRHPNEVEDAVPFDRNESHSSYDPEYASRFHRALVSADRVFKEFRSRYLGKVSPVHFFWGSFDHAVTRFSGRPAPPHPGGVPNLPDWVAREAYSHEVSSAGFWPGAATFPRALFYSYAYPPPHGFEAATVRPAEASFNENLGEFVLAYDDVRTAKDPDATILTFLESTYEAAADAGEWDRTALEPQGAWPPRA